MFFPSISVNYLHQISLPNFEIAHLISCLMYFVEVWLVDREALG